MSGAEWDMTQYKHLDHHLRQFGASLIVGRLAGESPSPSKTLRLAFTTRRISDSKGMDGRGQEPGVFYASMKIGLLIIAVLLTASSVLAHHSNAAFDGDKVIVLKGTVTQWKWTNPHVWILLSVDDGKGGKVDWAIEGRTPGQLLRAGWSRSILKAGDIITVDFSPAKDGTRTGLLTRVRLADGTVLGQAPAAQ